jgi:hypothetical protein
VSDVGEEIRQRLLALPVTRPGDLEGATEDEARSLEEYAGGTLPLVYRQFLRHLGRSSGELFRGTECAIGQRSGLRLKRDAEQIARSGDPPFTLPPRAFVFLMSQGYQFSFFDAADGDDPPVYHYLEGEPRPKKLADSLSSYLRSSVEDCERRLQFAERP